MTKEEKLIQVLKETIPTMTKKNVKTKTEEEELTDIDNKIDNGLDVEELKKLKQHVVYLAYNKFRYSEKYLQFILRLKCINEFLEEDRIKKYYLGV